MTFKKILLATASTLLLFTITLPINAQQVSSLLENAIKRLQKGSEIIFQLDATQEGMAVYHTRGKVLLQKDKFRLRYDSYDVCFDGEELSYYDFKENTFTLLSHNSDEMLQINPLLLLSKGLDHYEITPLNEKNGKYRIKLIPKEKGGLYQGIVVSLNKNTKEPTSIEITTTEGLHTIVSLTKIILRNDLKKTQFKQPIELYSKSEIIDLR